jgi:cytochrome c-type biogenesis protein CcmF
VERDGRKVTQMTTVKSYFPSLAPFLGPISRFFEGEATSEVGLKAGWRRDVWTAIAPDIGALRPRIQEGDKVFAGANLTPQQRDAFLGQALAGLARSYAKNPPPATFRLIVSPMVTWIWIGALIAFLGGLIALWPQPRGARSAARAAYAARVGREVRIPA